METQVFTHPDLPGVTIRSMGSRQPSRDVPQSVVVTLEPDTVIPLHSHRTDAFMYISAGCGVILSEDDRNGLMVLPGTTVHFRANEKHGFMSTNTGLQFVSANGGIVDESPDNWDITFDEGTGFWTRLWQWISHLFGL
jgi:quercetin dioxygenase-like cupin family protein